MIKANLYYGVHPNSNKLYISTLSRLNNIAIIGSPNYQQHMNMFISLAEQDILNKDIGTTIVTSDESLAYILYSFAKENKRKVILIDYDLLFEQRPNIPLLCSYDFINETIINYKRAIAGKNIVIIYTNECKYQYNSIKLTEQLLNQFIIDSKETQITKSTPHFVYIDNNVGNIVNIPKLLRFSYSGNYGVVSFCDNQPKYLHLFKNLLYSPMINIEDYISLSKYIKLRAPLNLPLLSDLNKLRPYSYLYITESAQGNQNMGYSMQLDDYNDITWMKGLDEYKEKGLKTKKRERKKNEIKPVTQEQESIDKITPTKEVVNEKNTDEPLSSYGAVLEQVNKQEEKIKNITRELSGEERQKKEKTLNNYFTAPKVEFCEG